MNCVKRCINKYVYNKVCYYYNYYGYYYYYQVDKNNSNFYPKRNKRTDKKKTIIYNVANPFSTFLFQKDHLASCPLKIVSCTNKNCREIMTRNNLQKHMTSTCPWRNVRCTHCRVSHAECKTKVRILIVVASWHGGPCLFLMHRLISVPCNYIDESYPLVLVFRCSVTFISLLSKDSSG